MQENSSLCSGSRPLIFLSVSSDSQLVLFSTSTCVRALNREKWTIMLCEESFGGARLALALHAKSPLFLLVSSGDKPGTSSRKLKVWNAQKRSAIKELVFSSTIDALRWTQRELAVMVEREIHLFDLRSLALRAVLPYWPQSKSFALSCWAERDTQKEKERADESVQEEERLLVFPCAQKVGWVSVFDAKERKMVNEFLAHRSAITAMAVTRERLSERFAERDREKEKESVRVTGRLATASAMGTIVRVFSLPAGQVLFSFRLSSLRSLVVRELAFCPRGEYLVARTAENALALCPLFHVKRKIETEKEREAWLRQRREKELEKERRRERRVREAEEALRRKGECVELAVNEEEDGFCRIDMDGEGEEEGYNDDESEGQGGFYEEHIGNFDDTDTHTDASAMRAYPFHPHEDNSDAVSVLTEHSLYSERSTRIDTVVAPSAAALAVPPSLSSSLAASLSNTASNVFTGLLDQSSATLSALSLSSLWSNANAQNFVDATLAGVQRVQHYSQEIFDNGSSSAPSGSTSDNKSSSHANSSTLHIDLDKEIRRPILYLQCDKGKESDFIAFSLVYSSPPSSSSSTFSVFTREREESEESETPRDTLHLIVVSKKGLYRKVNLNVLRFESLASLQTQNVSYDPRDYYSSPSLSATCSCALDDLASVFEDERYFLDI